MDRRVFLKAAANALAVSAVGTVGYTLAIEPHWLEIVERDLPIEGLPPFLAGARLAQLSDLHIGPQVSDAYLIHSLDRISALKPDLVVITGDFISYSEVRGEAQFETLRAVLAQVPLATVGILGNHDYGRGWDEPVVAARVVAESVGESAT